MKKVLKEVSQLVEKFGTKKAIAILIITMLVSLLMLLSSCNVTRIVKTEASHFQKLSRIYQIYRYLVSIYLLLVQ